MRFPRDYEVSNGVAWQPSRSSTEVPLGASASMSCSTASLRGAMEIVAQGGYAHVACLVDARESERLRSWLADWPLTDAPVRVGPVRQRAQMAVIGPSYWGSQSALCELATRLQSAFAGSGWQPNEATVMSYQGRGAGITPHRDHRRYGLLIAILSLVGHGRLTIVADRKGKKTLAELDCHPGDLVLLRGVGLADPIDGSDPRPLHAVSAPAAGRRVSLTLRMDTMTPA